MNRIGILGGSFSPVHNGHLQIAQDALDEFSLEKVIFLPNGNPPHKKVEFFNYNNRVDMLNIAIRNNENFEISYIESDQSKIHYSYNTISENFDYNENELFFIMGEDEFLSLKSWYKYEKLLEICNIIVFTRNKSVEYMIEENKEIIEKYKVFFMNNTLISISSTEIRERIKKHRSIKYLVSDKVNEYIYNSINYYDIDRIKLDLKSKLKESRYNHSLRVAQYCKKLGKIYNLDYEKLYLAGLCHDCSKGLEEYYMLNSDFSSDIILDDEDKSNYKIIHSPIGAVIAEKLYGLKDLEIINSIKYHTTARANMTLFEKIVFISDKIEPARNYSGVDVLRELAEKDIDLAIVKFLENNFDYLKNIGENPHRLSYEAYEDLKK